ncbi:hypothetical protein LEP1GSC050_0693 [Leptospira broomii serovar Hurstbridge str. 5399]|uniref:Activator of Hsp90 ATPase homologue 1/2-like C-terminal domain-containing protein n=1 Tax=Leptospira broomii serovar Hurstbridge str. 5399 TaxID=1049789 RepID=T0FFP6_9LEPT|nr:SRPBCC domain-containing protein [Leptospira broomii]EQA46711.1 hypothetical protein LEP1GSC050_0693 [Leptospira broomii serovar Hurstbridge str. 5399]
MSKSEKTLEFKFERTIPALPSDVFDGWLNPKIPGNPWHMADKLLLDPKVDGMFYWTTKDTPHYGLFTEVERPSRIRHTWMSPNTLGRESTVTVTFRKQGDETLMTLVHSNLPEDDKAKSHEKGWNYFLDMFPKQFGSVSSEKK